MSKLIICFSFFILLSFPSSAFKVYYIHGAGFKYNYANVRAYKKSLDFSSFTFTYKATFASLNLMKNYHFACSFYPAIGLSYSNKIDNVKSSFSSEIPIMLEWYYGIIGKDCKYFGVGITNTFFYKSKPSITNQTFILGPQIEYGKQYEKESVYIGYRINLAYGLNSPKLVDPSTNNSYREKKFLLGINLYVILDNLKNK